MDKWNGSHVSEFILLGLTDDPQMKILIFVVFLIIYLFTISGNITLIIVCINEPRLHKPMYFFIVNLSFLDLFYSTIFIPNTLAHLFMKRWIISLAGCAAHIYAYLVLACTESVVLSVMAFDRYVAICFPLHYTNIMNPLTCTKMVVASWVNAILLPIPVIAMTLVLPLCGRNVLNHFVCELVTIIKMACADTFIVEIVFFVAVIIIVLIPFFIILLSYVHITATILKIRSFEGRQKAFSTCVSHLINVSVMYVTALFMYMKPTQNIPPNDAKMISVFYTIGPPLWNPIVYSLRNKEIKMALRNSINI
ncbi:olfactory receptor 2G3-like [Lissotriton helveticus]